MPLIPHTKSLVVVIRARVQENVCSNSKKRKKSRFLGILKESKNVKTYVYSFTGT